LKFRPRSCSTKKAGILLPGFFCCTPGMGDNSGAKVSCGRCPDEPLAEGNCEGVNLGGEEAGEQNLDWMNKN
jgi:hypothetical protein